MSLVLFSCFLSKIRTILKDSHKELYNMTEAREQLLVWAFVHWDSMLGR